MDDGLYILIDEDGDIAFVHDDRLEALFDHQDGEITIRRVSQVEPATYFGWDCAGWLADMRLVNGPLLHDGYEAGRPGVKQAFATRAAALAAERTWLRENLGL